MVFLPGEPGARNFGDIVERTGKTHMPLVCCQIYGLVVRTSQIRPPSGQTTEGSGHGLRSSPTGLPVEQEFLRRPGTRFYVGLKSYLKLKTNLDFKDIKV